MQISSQIIQFFILNFPLSYEFINIIFNCIGCSRSNIFLKSLAISKNYQCWILLNIKTLTRWLKFSTVHVSYEDVFIMHIVLAYILPNIPDLPTEYAPKSFQLVIKESHWNIILPISVKFHKNIAIFTQNLLVISLSKGEWDKLTAPTRILWYNWD